MPHRKLNNDIEADVLVIGAGITGAMVADALTMEGFKVIVVDRRGPAKGSTKASTALVQYEIDTPLTILARTLGKRNAVRAWRRSRLAVDALAVRLRELNIAFQRRDTLYLAGNVLNAKALAREHEARLAAGFPGRLLSRRELNENFGIRAGAAILGYGDLVLDPTAVTCGLLRAACQSGAKIFAPADVVDIDFRRSVVVAMIANGKKIQARHLVFATGYEFPKRVPQRGHRIISTWAISTIRQPGRLWPGECMICEASDPYLYVRTTPDGRVMCGGEDEEFSREDERDKLLARKTARLQRKLARLIPSVETRVEFAWTGSFGSSSTGLPSIGQLPRMPRCWAAFGYGGNGTTYARIAADVIAGALVGRPDVDADLYRVSRRRR